MAVEVNRVYDSDSGRLLEIQVTFTDREGDTARVDVISEGQLFFYPHPKPAYTVGEDIRVLLECVQEMIAN